MKVLLASLLLAPVFGAPDIDADYAPTKEGNLRSLQQQQQQQLHYPVPLPAPVSCDICPCGYNDGCNSCGCDERGFAFCTLRACMPEEFGEPSCNACPDDRCCDLSDRPKGAIEAPLCCPDGTWVGNIGDGSGTCPNGMVVSSRLGNEGDVCTPTCDDCPCGFNDGCNECMCEAGGLTSCTERACLIQGTPFCKECPVADKCCDPRTEPGMFGNPPSREGHQCCGVTGEWVGSIGDGKTIPCGNQLISSGYGKPCPEPVAKCCDITTRPPGIEASICCQDGTWAGNIGDGSGTCGDGSVVVTGRNEGEICALTCDECPCGYNDGCNTCGCDESGFARCTLRACFPGEVNEPSCNKCEDKCCDLADRPVGAIEAPVCCPDGTWAGNIGDGSATCPDGSIVVSGSNEGDICTPTCETCPCGYNDGCNDCSCGPDGDLIGCTDLACLVQGPPSCSECSVEPLCCDPLKEPGQFGNPIGFEGHRCCAATGEWVFSIGDARTFSCGGSLVTSGFGERCYEASCCDPLQKPGAGGGPIPFEEPLCCSDGTWIGNRGDGQGLCQGVLINANTQGEVCDEDVFCTQDVQSCPDGSFVGRDPASGCSFFPCPDDEVFCTADAMECPDGSFVGRDPDNGCDFFPCPTVQCPPRRRWCRWSRRWVRLDPEQNCDVFFPCYWHWHW